MDRIDSLIQQVFFSEIRFSDERERQVFLSYLRGFIFLVFDPGVKTLLEIGGGQSTTLLAKMGERLDWTVITIDMNPEAIALKLRSQALTDRTLERIRFRKGVSIEPARIARYYSGRRAEIGGIPFAKAARAAATFIDTSMDDRRAVRVADALGLDRFSADGVIDAVVNAGCLPPALVDSYRHPHDELEAAPSTSGVSRACMEEILQHEVIDAIFLDSGEFSSLPEWEVVQPKIRDGGYIVLHDIFFPKSFKNWLVCGSILANPAYESIYIDRSTPQGLMIARKRASSKADPNN